MLLNNIRMHKLITYNSIIQACHKLLGFPHGTFAVKCSFGIKQLSLTLERTINIYPVDVLGMQVLQPILMVTMKLLDAHFLYPVEHSVQIIPVIFLLTFFIIF